MSFMKVMMKSLSAICKSAYIIYIFSVNIGNAQQEKLKGTNALPIIVRQNEANSLLHHECLDFRRLILAQETVESMETRSVCYFYLFGFPMNKAESGAKSCEIPIKGNVTVRQILDAAGMKKWISGQPQIKHISKCSIMQSPLTGKRIKSDENINILGHRVCPGDIIMVATVQ